MQYVYSASRERCGRGAAEAPPGNSRSVVMARLQSQSNCGLRGGFGEKISEVRTGLRGLCHHLVLSANTVSLYQTDPQYRSSSNYKPRPCSRNPISARCRLSSTLRCRVTRLLSSQTTPTRTACRSQTCSGQSFFLSLQTPLPRRRCAVRRWVAHTPLRKGSNRSPRVTSPRHSTDVHRT